MNSREKIIEIAEQVPPGIWVLLAMVAAVGAWRAAGRRLRRAGARTADPELAAGRAARAKDTALTVASMIPAVLFWAVVLAGSFRGLIAFGRETLHWRDGWEYLVPGSLDGVSVTFALLAFRAVRRRKSPDRCYRVVWGAAIASAAVNFNYEYAASGYNLVAGGYLALLSLFGVVMFHEFLRQFEEGTDYIVRGKPAFGLRWITWPSNTFCAAVAWHNHPPTKGTAPTVRNAVANLERVRELKQAARETAKRERHERALVRARRQAELAGERDRSSQPTSSREPATGPINGKWGTPSIDPAKGAPVTSTETTTAEQRGQAPPAAVKVPGTTWRLQNWIDTWVRMCADGDLASKPVNNEQYAREKYGASARHLNNIRRAAISGTIRERARELALPLPPEYIDDPAPTRLNGKARVPA